MTMPNNLILVRHGHSEGNLATESAKKGDESFYTPEFRERPGHQWRLTAEGCKQAEATGQWLQSEIGTEYDKYYVSPYVRTRETAALLDLPDAKWRLSGRLRERDWGDIDALPRSEFNNVFPHNALKKEVDALYWRPPGGESIADVRLRVRSFFDTLHRECSEKTVIVVTHGEFMWAIRAELEYMSDEQWLKADKDPAQKIYNTQVIHYSRLNPKTNELTHYLNWVRSVCPWRAEDSKDTWREITRKTFTNEELLAQARSVERSIRSS